MNYFLGSLLTLGICGLAACVPQFKLKTLVHEDNGEDIPAEFDARKQWSNCESIREIRDESACGSSWAVAPTSVMSDRICIHSKQMLQTRVSTIDVLSCRTIDARGCDGGMPEVAWDQWMTEGIASGGAFNTSYGCKPYPFAPCDHYIKSARPCPSKGYVTPDCIRQCQDTKTQYENSLSFGKEIYKIKEDVRQIQLEIMKNGPVQARILVYGDLLEYKSGVYIENSPHIIKGQAVKIIGWGEENNTPYWLCANSWNENWGDKGLFKILRGKDHCEIELNVVAGLPKL